MLFEPGTLQAYISHLNQQCGLTLNNQTVLQYLSVSTTYNAAHALARGIEIRGRARFHRIAYIDYGYTSESSMQSGSTDNTPSYNPLVINGAQVAGIPLPSGQHLARCRTRASGISDRQLLHRVQQTV